MQPPCEIMADYFLPNMRGMVAHELKERGESQQKIATMLGITQARVSHYLSNKKSHYYSEISKRFGLTQTELEGFARILSDDVGRSQVDGIFTLYSIWKNLLFNGVVCAIHQKKSSISQDCSVCMDLHRPQLTPSKTDRSKDEDFTILHSLSEAVSSIENSSVIPQVMPEVSVNIAMCRMNPKSKGDVAAIPGRINKIHGRAKSFVLPEFGSSNHMSNVLLLFNSKASHIRSALNLRYDKNIDRSMMNLGVKRIFTKNNKHAPDDGHGYPQSAASTDQTVLQRLSRIDIPESWIANSLAFAVIDAGSEGLEPITYLFGNNASEITELALKIAHAYTNIALSNSTQT
jgi:XRE family transcriptional regulator, thiamine biosynthesis regulator